jgi:ABC-2 type transport system ATP-binding protein
MITIDRVSKTKSRTQILYDASFEARAGRVIGLLGPNGAGKTSTLRILLGLDRPQSGTALICGRPYRKLGRPLARSRTPSSR